MRQISILGFNWNHVVAVSSRHRDVDEMVFVTAEGEDPRAEDALEEVKRYAERIGAAWRTVRAPTSNIWKCVETVAPEFLGKPVILDLAGGVRSQGICAFMAALLTIELKGAKVVAVYTQAEGLGKIVPVDLRPLGFAPSLRGLKPTTRQNVLKRGVLKGQYPEDIFNKPYGRKLAKELEKHGLLQNGQLTDAASALAKILMLPVREEAPTAGTPA